ncbi:hypothetical protein BDE02_06G221100 [Populus trichocarpa]|nr:hypothetical protein BDE02_06G221100 [Populus trichocarpa]
MHMLGMLDLRMIAEGSKNEQEMFVCGVGKVVPHYAAPFLDMYACPFTQTLKAEDGRVK